MHRTEPFYGEFEKPPDTELPPITGSQSARVAKLPGHAGLSPRKPPTGKDFSVLPPTHGQPKIVMDPLAVLRQCIKFFSVHPEIYGTNLRALLDREVMHVMRLQSSETALAQQQPVTSSHDMNTAVEMLSKALLPPVESREKSDRKREPEDNLLGYGALTFMPMKPNFAAILEKVENHQKPQHANERLIADGTLDSNPDRDGVPNAPLNTAVRDVLLDSAENPLNGEGPILIDANGYEVSFLRRQLQQMEAAYNTKCIRLHELLEENTRLVAQLHVTEENSERWLTQYRESHSHVEALRRELEGWQEKAYKAELVRGGTGDTVKSGKHRHRNAPVAEQTRVEVERMTKLWRETEKNLQETRRALENSEKEANDTHDHLSDAFMFIERLERRVARRDRYISISSRRLRSFEEKYEKLMWCHEEVGSMVGAHSFVDHLLADDPIWSLFVFARMQRHIGDMYTLDDCVVASSHDKNLFFGRSNGGGRFMDDRYDTNLVYHMMADEASGLTERRGKTKRLRTNLHGAVGCKVLRWENMFCIDFLGGEDSMPNTTEMNRRKQPVLTLAALILPLRRLNGIRLDVKPPSPKPDRQGNMSARKKEEEPMVIPEDSGVPNSYVYDEATIRLLIRNFWRDRVEQFETNMRKRIEKSMTQVRKSVQSRLFHNLNDILDADEPSDDDEYGNEVIPNTFLGGLLNFVIKVCNKQNTGKEEDTNILLAVRGMTSADPNLWDDGRVFFASIAHAKIRTATAFDGPIPSPPELTPSMREMLSAMYFYAMEYKELDADFRLFYLVSHQLMPEVVGINFYATVEAFQRDCETLLMENLEPMGEHSELMERIKKDSSLCSSDPFKMIVDENHPHALLSPMEAVAKASELVDRAPLVAESVFPEEDSDEEGYGSILPGSKEKPVAIQAAAGRGGLAVSISSVSQLSSPVSSSRAKFALNTTQVSAGLSSVTSAEPVKSEAQNNSIQQSPNPIPNEKQSLGHNILEYLESVKHRRSEQAQKEYEKRQAKLDEEAKLKLEDPIEPWERVDDEIMKIFSPNQRLSKRYRDAMILGTTGNAFNSHRQRRIAFEEIHRKSLAAARGLLPVEDILMLFHKHCFATYAITCCGTPRFFFPCAIKHPTEHRSSYYDPFTPIGKMPPLSCHLRRLRCALALDQPSTLINPRQLFSTDVNTFTPTHFYDEFLTLTLDYFAQQQNYIMDTVLSACRSRHEQYSMEGAEECDGRVPMSVLKKGFMKTFSNLHISLNQSAAFVEHLHHYNELLRLEDDVQTEQFTDAPFFIDSEPEVPDEHDDSETEWAFEDEASDCSLLCLSLAVRMIYPVWGPSCAVQARRLADVLETWTPITRVNTYSIIPPIIQVHAPPTPFSQDAQRMYLTAAHHLAEGNSGNLNPLRVTARWIAEEERVKEEAQLGHPNPEASEYHFGVSNDKKLINGSYPNWNLLRQVLTKAWKMSSSPEGMKLPKKPKVGRMPKEENDKLGSKENEAEAFHNVDPAPIRDIGLFVLSRAMGTSRSYALRGSVGSKSARRHFVLPFGVELQMHLQHLHFRNSVSLLQRSRLQFMASIKHTKTPRKESLQPHEAGRPFSKGSRRISGAEKATAVAPHGSVPTPSLVATFRFGTPGTKTTASLNNSTKNEPVRKDDSLQVYVEDLKGCFAALSAM